MLRAGLIGFPSVGKTTLFRLLTNAREAPRGRGGETHVGVAQVPDERLDRITALYRPRARVPATVEFADLAATGRTDGKALLDIAAFRDANALLHVVRAFHDETIPHAPGPVDPARDVRLMEDELILADLEVAERRLERIARDLKKGLGAELAGERDVVTRCREVLEEGRPLRGLELDQDDRRRLRGFQFLSAKPLLVVVNLDERDVTAADRVVETLGLQPFLSGAATHGVPVCARIELEIAQLDAEDAAAFLADLNLRESGLDRVIRASYELLGYISFFTVGEDECRAWSIPRATRATVAAEEIHSDIARGFIRAEVVPYDRLSDRGSMAACREHGEVRLEGKSYEVQDGDVINFRFAT